MLRAGEQVEVIAVSVIVRTSDPADIIWSLPQQNGTATVVAGTGSVLMPTAVVYEFSRAPGAPPELIELAERLIEQEAEEDMVSALPGDTGLDNAIKIIPGNPRHGPRIKVAINPPNRFVDGGATAVIPFGEDSISDPIPAGVVPPKVEQQLRQFIELNRQVLLAVDRDPEEGGISGVALGAVLRRISR